MEYGTAIDHTYKDFDFRIHYGLKEIIGEEITVQNCDVFLRTNRGTWHSQIKASLEFMDEPNFKDYICEEAIHHYTKRVGFEPVKV